ncbi:MAG: putative glycoside hydrolase [Bacteroides sp.]|nr:putative glycoside hydrolase [Eubacterium sp.]MCM1418785.1 putative glycoside hydrolase [Roseburia sp.]MCM1462442.1 putative glycoside hydrolase [Bacteroides sp.]
MKNRKRYGRKIKRSKTNLYKRRKTAAEKAVGTILLIVAILAALFLGYCLGKPLLEFFEKNADRAEPEWTPPVLTSAEETPPEADDPSEGEETSGADEPAPVSDGTTKAIAAPTTALLNSASLSAFTARARSDGYNTVVLELKDESGYLRYASEAAKALGGDLVQSQMTAAEIADVIRGAGLSPIAAVSVLSDDAGCKADPDLSYKIIGETISWLDYSTGSPLRWVDPKSAAAGEYLSAILGELKAAGIPVILKDLVFPDLHPYDREYLAGEYFEPIRSAFLLPLVPEDTPVEMRAEDVLAEGNGLFEGYGRTAEILHEREFTERAGGSVAVRISRASFPTDEGYPADAAGLVEDLLARLRAKLGSLAVIPVIESEGFSAAELSAIKELLADRSYIIA